MGANNSTRRVSYESDENENVTVVKGIRLSENVINRMREPATAPPFVPNPRPAPPSTLIPPPPPPETVPTPSPPPQPEQVEAPTIIDMVLPSSSPAAFEPPLPLATPAPPSPPPAAAAVEPVTTCFASPTPADATVPAVVNTVTPLPPPLIEPTAPSPVASPPALLLPDSQPLSSLPVSEPVTTLPPPPQAQAPVGPVSSSPVPESSPVPPRTPAAAPAIDEESLKKISDELYEGLEKQRVKTEQELQAWLEAEKARAAAQAQADTKRHVEDEVSRILSAERVVAQESIQQAVLRERIATEDEKLRAQLYAKQLEAKEADLHKQEVFYREQVARLEEKSAQFYKVTTENYHTAADQVNAKFKRYEAYPVCADLQGQILACYNQNAGKTLHCSNIAALYLQCVNNAKQKNKHAASWTDDTPS
uniref:coiled-coil-helix-coiled-coil-helix domain containing 3a isoform X2 n=1 Tax=Doryrhamphus excisus TaxID=161450 RepID=UPI0025ADF716|nr:coiled-coil-helix-coiled-coil-helix domain containing 3a isoform X2 [Doryrhamphus excisus]